MMRGTAYLSHLFSTNTLAAVEAMGTEGGSEGREAARDSITGEHYELVPVIIHTVEVMKESLHLS